MRYLEKVLVTGAAGFIGSELVQLLLSKGLEVLAVDDLSKGRRESLPKETNNFTFTLADLRDRSTAIRIIRGCNWVFHLASRAYGVAYSGKSHSETFVLNSQINSNVVEAVVQNGVPGLLAVSSSCVYSDDLPDSMTEDLGFQGEPEQANWGYGWAKRMLEVAALSAVRDRKCEAVVVRPVNVYGPNYDWFGEYSHVIPSLVKRILDGDNPLVIWGDGTQARSFMHVKDVARALFEISLCAPNGTVLNLGDEQATTINEIANILRSIFGKDFEVEYDLTKPTGRKVKSVSSKLLKEILPRFEPQIPLPDGLTEMKAWYDRHKSIGSF